MIYERTPSLRKITAEQFLEYEKIESKVLSQALKKTGLVNEGIDLYSYIVGFKTVKKDDFILAERKADLTHTEIMESILGVNKIPSYYIVDNRLITPDFKASVYQSSVSNNNLDFYDVLTLNLIDFCYAAKIQIEINKHGRDEYFESYKKLPKREHIMDFLNKAAVNEFDIEQEIIDGLDATELLDDDKVNRVFFSHKVSWFYNKYNDKEIVKQITSLVKKARVAAETTTNNKKESHV